jgi:hypothetical protein
VARLERPAEARGAGGLDQAHLGGGGELGCDLDEAGGEAAAADRDDEEIRGAGELVEDLERDRRLALDHVGVVEGRQEQGAHLGGEGLRSLQRRVEVVADQPGLDPAAAELPGLVDLLLRRRDRHEDDALDAEVPAGEGHALRVVAGRGADEAPALGTDREGLAHGVEGPAQLVGADRAQILALQPDLGAVLRRQKVVALQGRRLEELAQRRLGGAHVLEETAHRLLRSWPVSDSCEIRPRAPMHETLPMRLSSKAFARDPIVMPP